MPRFIPHHPATGQPLKTIGQRLDELGVLIGEMTALQIVMDEAFVEHGGPAAGCAFAWRDGSGARRRCRADAVRFENRWLCRPHIEEVLRARLDVAT